MDSDASFFGSVMKDDKICRQAIFFSQRAIEMFRLWYEIVLGIWKLPFEHFVQSVKICHRNWDISDL